MDDFCKNFLNNSGINFESLNELDGKIISRELLINPLKYAEMKDEIINLKKNYSSTSLTGLHDCADIKQRWPLLNIVRQLLNVYNMDMEPFRKSDGYEVTGKKKYKRFFIIKKRV